MSAPAKTHADLPAREKISAYTFVNEYNARTLPLKLALIVCTLVLLHIAFMFMYYEMKQAHYADRFHWYQVMVFDLDTESGFGTYYSSMALLFIGRLLWHHAKLTQVRGEVWSIWWFILAVGFHWLSLDEVIAGHEVLNEHKSVLAKAAGEERERWTAEGLIVAGFVGAAFLPFLWRIGWRLSVFAVIGGLIYLGGALGIEQATDKYQDWGMLNTTEYQMWVALEEGMEMIGPVIFLYGLMGYFARDKTRVREGEA